MFFHAFTFAGSQFKNLPKDLASISAMKQTCMMSILAYVTLFQLNSH